MCYYSKERAVIVVDHSVARYKEITKDTAEVLHYLETMLKSTQADFELAIWPDKKTYYEEIVNRIKYWINELKEGK